MAEKQLNYRVYYTVDKSGLVQLKQELKDLQSMTLSDLIKIDSNATRNQLNNIKQSAKEVEAALNKAFNSNLGTVNVTKFNQELKNLKIDEIYQKLSDAGAVGKSVFRGMANEAMSTNVQLKESHKLLDNLAKTMGNTIKWGATSAIFNAMTNSLQQAWTFTKALDTSLNDIRIVSGKSADEMERFAVQANKAAQSLGKNTRDYTEASLIYYQQGLSDEEVVARTETTLKAANVTGQKTADVSEQLTAVWNGYKVSAAETEKYIDKLAAVASNTASNLEELSTGMSKVAAAANTAGIDFDQLTAILSTVISVTREAPETVGSSFKTIFARLGDLAIDGEDEFGVKLGTVSGQMEKLGIQILDEQGDMRDMGKIIEDTAEKWQTWTQAQKQAAAVAMGGKMQYSRLVTLFENWDKYGKAINTAENSLGTLQEQQDIYMESTAAHLQQLSTAWERVFNSFVDNKGINDLVDIFTDMTNGFANFVEAIGGGGKALETFGAIATNVFQRQIGNGIATMITNIRLGKENLAEYNAALENLKKIKNSKAGQQDEALQKMIANTEELKEMQSSLGMEEQKEANELYKQLNGLLNKKQSLEDQKQQQEEIIQKLTKQKVIIDEIGNKSSQTFAIYTREKQKIQELVDLLDDIREKSGNTEEKFKFNKGKEDTLDNFIIKLKRAQELITHLNEHGIDLSKNKFFKGDADLLGLENIKITKTNLQDIENLLSSKGIGLSIEGLQTQARTLGITFNNVPKEVERINKELQGTGYQLTTVTDDVDKLKKKFQDIQLGQSFSSLISGLSSLFSIFNTATSLKDIISNDTLSNWEKFAQIGMNVTMMISMLIPAVKNLKMAKDNLWPSIQKITAQTLIESGALKLDEKVTLADEAAKIKLDEATTVLLRKLGLFLLTIAPIIIAVGALSAAIYAGVKAYNEDADAAKKATEAVKDLAETNNQVQQTLENIKSSFNTYDTAVEKLEKCTKGTQEWKEALEEVNEAALKTIEAIPEGYDVNNLYDRDKQTGKITLKAEEINKIQQDIDLQSFSSQLSSYASQTRADMAQASYNVLKTTRDMSSTAWNITDNLSLIALGLNNFVLNEQEAQIMQERIVNHLSEFAEGMTLDEFKNKMNSLGMDLGDLTNNELKSYQNELQKLATSTAAAADKLRLLSEVQISDFLGEDYDGASVSIANEQLLGEQQRIYDRIIKNSHNALSAASNDGSEYYQELADRLQEATKGQYKAATGNTVLGWDDDRRFKFLDTNSGEEVEKSEEWLASIISAYEAFEEVGENADKAVEALTNLDQTLGVDLANHIREFITSGSLESLTENEIQLLAEMDKQALANALGVSLEQVNDMLGKYDFSDFQNALKNADMAMTSFVDKYAVSVKNVLNNLIDSGKLSNSSVQERKKLGDYLQNIRSTEGIQGLQEIEKVLNELDSTQMGGFLQVLNEIEDWSQVTPTNLKNTLENLGININFTDEQLQKLINTFYKLSNSAETLEQRYKSSHDIIDKLKQGDVISAENYEKLSTVGQQYFQKMLDGSYKLVEQADNLQRAVENSFIEEAANNYIDMADTLTKYQNIMTHQDDIKKLKFSENINITDSNVESVKNNLVDKKQKQIESLQDTINEDYNFGSYMQSIGEYGLSGGIIGTGIGLAIPIPVVDDVAGAVIGSIAGGITGVVTKSQEKGIAEDSLKELQATKTEYENFFNNFSYSIDDLNKINEYLQNASLDENARVSLENLKTSIESVKDLPKKVDDVTKDYDTYKTNIEQSLEILKDTGYDKEQLSKWEDKWTGLEYKDKQTGETKKSELSNEDIIKIQEAVQGLTDEQIEKAIETQRKKMYEYQSEIAATAKSIEDLNEKKKQFGAINSIDENIWGHAENELWEEERQQDLKSEDVEGYSGYIKDMADDTKEFSDDLNEVGKNSKQLEIIDEIADDLSIEIQNMNKAVDILADNWEDWSDILNDSTAGYEEHYVAIKNTKDALSKLLDVQSEYIDDSVITEHMDEITRAAKGDEEAIDSLRAAALDKIIIQLSIDDSDFVNSEGINSIADLQSQIDALLPDGLGADFAINGIEESEQKLLDACNSFIETAGLTEAQVNSLFGLMGFDAQFEQQTETLPQKIPITTQEHIRTVTKYDEHGNPTEWTDEDLPPKTRYEDATGEYESYAFAAIPYDDKIGKAATPKIKNISRKANGAANNYSSKNSGGKSPGKSGGGGKSPGKSGGGGKGSEPNKEKPIEDKYDPYHDIDIKIKQVSTSLDKLTSQQKKFFGQKLINNLNKQWDLLNQQIENSKVKIEIARREMSRLQGELSSKGMTFNADGTIANYAQVYQSQVNYINSLIDTYNTLSADAQKDYKENVLDPAKEAFEELKNNISEYDKTITDIIPGLEKDIQDAIDKQIEIKIEEFTMEIKIRLDMSEAERDWNEFKRKVIDGIKDDDILGNAKAKLTNFNSYYNTDNTGEVQSLMKQVQNTQRELEQMDKTGWSDWYGDNRAQALEDLKSYNDQLMKSMENVEDLIKEIKKSYLDMMDKAADKFKDQIDMYEQVKDIIDHDMNIIKLVYGEDSYKELAKYYQMQEDNNNKQLDFLRQQKDFWYNQMQTLEEGSDEWEKAKENWMSAVSEWNKKVEEAVENIKDKYLNTINEIFDELNNKVTNGAGLDYVAEEWELINKNADQYLDTINSLYGIQSLENKYLDAIDKTDNLSAQRKLNALMEEELGALREKDKLTQYDIDRANKKYEIALKQIALEEAQQNKSTMRLRRDSQGNYTYQYVADNDQVGQLQDELSQLKNELYNFDLEHYRDNLDQVLEIYQEFQEKMKEAAQINDPEERAAMELLLQEQYGELINGLVEQNETIRFNLHESAFTELADLYNTDLNNFQTLSDEEKDVLLSQMIPQWDSGIQQMSDKFAGEGGFIPTCKDAMDKLAEATKTYQQDLDEIQQAAGQDFGALKDGIDETKTKTEELIQDNGALIETYQQQLQAVQAVINELQSLVSQYNAAKIAAQQAAEAAYNYWRAVNNQAANDASNNVSSGSSGSRNSSSNSNNENKNSSSGSGGSNNGSGDGNGATIGNKITFSGSYYYDSFGTTPSGNKYSGVDDGVTIDIVNNNPYGIHIKSSDGKYPDLGWIKKSQVTRWNTGGYTGDWGDDSGRLAILDRKELVLDKNDTSNMLNILEITRGIMSSMNASIFSRIANSINGIQNSNMGSNGVTDTLEQNVHIDASFPNVKDSREIETALNNLVNVASQRIGQNYRQL